VGEDWCQKSNIFRTVDPNSLIELQRRDSESDLAVLKCCSSSVDPFQIGHFFAIESVIGRSADLGHAGARGCGGQADHQLG
jgi:hypothetical protein